MCSPGCLVLGDTDSYKNLEEVSIRVLLTMWEPRSNLVEMSSDLRHFVSESDNPHSTLGHGEPLPSGRHPKHDLTTNVDSSLSNPQSPLALGETREPSLVNGSVLPMGSEQPKVTLEIVSA